MKIDSTMEEIVKILKPALSEDMLYNMGRREKLEQAIAMYALSAITDSRVAKEVKYICSSITE